jgi:hypothetical protein
VTAPTTSFPTDTTADERPTFTVIRIDWSSNVVLSTDRTGDEMQHIPILLGDHARLPVLNYAVKVLAETVCLRSAIFATPTRCSVPAIEGTPVSSYPDEESTGRIR